MFSLPNIITIGFVCGLLQSTIMNARSYTPLLSPLVSFDKSWKDIYCIEPSLERNRNKCVVFFTGGSSTMTPRIYSNFLSTVLEKNISVCVPSFRYPNIDVLMERLNQEFKEVIVAGHSSGCTVALNTCARNSVRKIILMDPVNTRFNDTTRKFEIPNIDYILFLNAMKSYKTTFDPFGLPFIPVANPSLSFIGINETILNTHTNCEFTYIDYPNNGHCDILNPGWANLMHYTRMAVGNRARTLEMFKTYHAHITNAWYDFIQR